MYRVCILGGWFEASGEGELKTLHRALRRLCSEAGWEIHTLHWNDSDCCGTDSVRVCIQKSRERVRTSDLAIAYVGVPSLIGGMELAYVAMFDVPLVLLYEQGRYVHRVLRNLPSLIAEVEFRDCDEALDQLRAVLGEASLRTVERFDVKQELHIETTRSSSADKRRFVIWDGAGRLVFEVEATLGDNTNLRRALENLTSGGASPKAVYIEAFSGIADDVRSVWPNAEVLMDYW